MLFFSALLCVFCPSPFMKKRKPQPSPVGGILGGNHEWAGWSWADAMRATERNAEAEKAGLENEAAYTKNQPIYFSTVGSKSTWERSENKLTALTRPIPTQGGASGVGMTDAVKLAR